MTDFSFPIRLQTIIYLSNEKKKKGDDDFVEPVFPCRVKRGNVFRKAPCIIYIYASTILSLTRFCNFTSKLGSCLL